MIIGVLLMILDKVKGCCTKAAPIPDGDTTCSPYTHPEVVLDCSYQLLILDFIRNRVSLGITSGIHQESTNPVVLVYPLRSIVRKDSIHSLTI